MLIGYPVQKNIRNKVIGMSLNQWFSKMLNQSYSFSATAQ